MRAEASSSLANQTAPRIQTPLPGPRSRALIERDERYTSPSYTRVYPLAVKRGAGLVLEDLDGNLFLDFNAGIAVCATGHCHPEVVAAIQQQADQLLHMSGTDFYYGPQAELAETLAQLAPGSAEYKVFLSNSGTEAVEAAVKLARYHTGRHHVVAFCGAFHGRTMGSLSLTGSKAIQRRGFGPLVPSVHHVDYPYCYQCPQRPEAGGCCQKSEDQLKRLFRQLVPPDEVAAIVVEPIQGEGGYIVPPVEFLGQLRALADQHGILLVADEVQSGMGRTGAMLAVEHFGVEPDIICLAKGLASGMPLGAIVAKASVMTWPSGAHASTFGGNPVACVAAQKTIELLRGGLIENARTQGNYLQQRLRDVQARNDAIGDVRGLGLMIGVELVQDLVSRQPAVELRNAVVQAAFRRGLLLLGCGQSTIRFCPPLVVNQAQIDTAVELFELALNESQQALEGSSTTPSV